MRSYMLSVLLLIFMTVSLSEQRWFRRSLKRVAKYVTKHDKEINAALTLAHAFGKREAGLPPCPPSPPGKDGAGMDRQSAMQVLEKLQLQCSKFNVDPQTGLAKTAVIAAFDATNGNGDQSLDKDELLKLENVLGAFEHCLETETESNVQ